MRVLLTLALVACTEPVTVMTDAGVDAFGVPPGTNYGPCYSWDEISPTLDRCAPRCWNYGTVGKSQLNGPESCMIADGVYCDPKFITGPSWHQGVGCCLYSSEPERVDFVACR